MKAASRIAALALVGSAGIALAAGMALAQDIPVGQPLGTTNEAGTWTPLSENVRVFGSFRFAESCTFDPDRNLIIAMNRGVGEQEIPNDGFVSLINPDGTVHTSKWIGVQNPGNQRDEVGFELRNPLGSALMNGVLYAADINMVRMFDVQTGQPIGAFEVAEATGLNGIAVTADGTIYASNTGGMQRIYRVTADGQSSVFVDGAPLASPNGVAIDNDGNIVVVNIANNEVLTFNPQGELILTEHAAESGNDGLVIMADGTKYVSSVRFGSISRIAPGGEAEIIATGIPSAASMCYDSVQNQLVVPMNNHNALAFVPLD
jgi:hypothetical protein